jgi:hypothetical protein
MSKLDIMLTVIVGFLAGAYVKCDFARLNDLYQSEIWRRADDVVVRTADTIANPEKALDAILDDDTELATGGGIYDTLQAALGGDINTLIEG